MIAIRQNTTFNTGKFPNQYLASLCTRLCWYCEWKKRVGWEQCVKPSQRDWNCPGMRENAGVGIAQAQGAALHSQRLGVAQVTSYPKKQRVLLRSSVARSPPAALRKEMPAALHGQCHAMRALKTSKPSMFAAGDFQRFLCYTREEGQPIPCKI